MTDEEIRCDIPSELRRAVTMVASDLGLDDRDDAHVEYAGVAGDAAAWRIFLSLGKASGGVEVLTDQPFAEVLEKVADGVQ